MWEEDEVASVNELKTEIEGYEKQVEECAFTLSKTAKRKRELEAAIQEAKDAMLNELLRQTLSGKK